MYTKCNISIYIFIDFRFQLNATDGQMGWMDRWMERQTATPMSRYTDIIKITCIDKAQFGKIVARLDLFSLNAK